MGQTYLWKIPWLWSILLFLCGRSQQLTELDYISPIITGVSSRAIASGEDLRVSYQYPADSLERQAADTAILIGDSVCGHSANQFAQAGSMLTASCFIPPELQPGRYNLSIHSKPLLRSSVNNASKFSLSSITGALRYICPLRGDCYHVQVQPVISKVSPSTGSLAGGQALTISGRAFQQNATVVAGGNSCIIQNLTSSSLTCLTAPASIPAKSKPTNTSNEVDTMDSLLATQLSGYDTDPGSAELLIQAKRDLMGSSDVPMDAWWGVGNFKQGVVFEQWNESTSSNPARSLEIPSRAADLITDLASVEVPPGTGLSPFTARFSTFLSLTELQGNVSIWVSSSGWVDLDLYSPETNETILSIKSRTACVNFFCEPNQHAKISAMKAASAPALYRMQIVFSHWTGEPHLSVGILVPADNLGPASNIARETWNIRLQPPSERFTQSISIQNVSAGNFLLQSGMQNPILTQQDLGPFMWNEDLEEAVNVTAVDGLQSVQRLGGSFDMSNITWVFTFTRTTFEGQCGIRVPASNLTCLNNTACTITISTTQAGTTPVHGAFSLIADGKSSEPLEWGASAVDIKDCISNLLPGVVRDVTVSAFGGTDSGGYNYSVSYVRIRSVETVLAVDTSDLRVGNTNLSVVGEAFLDNELSNATLLWPIPLQILRTPSRQFQVQVYVDGIGSVCLDEASHCTYKPLDSQTPVISGAKIVRTPTENESGQIVIVGSRFGPLPDQLHRSIEILVNAKECKVASATEAVIVCNLELDLTAGNHSVHISIPGRGIAVSDSPVILFSYNLQIEAVSANVISILGGGQVILKGMGFGDRKEICSCQSADSGLSAEIQSISPSELIFRMPKSPEVGAQRFVLALNGVQTSFSVTYSDEAPALLQAISVLAPGQEAFVNEAMPGFDPPATESSHSEGNALEESEDYSSQVSGFGSLANQAGSQVAAVSSVCQAILRVSGTDLNAQSSTVRVGNQDCEILYQNATSLVCTLDPGPSGDFELAVSVGSFGLIPNSFIVRREFSIEAISPSTGSLQGGQVLAIRGTGFPVAELGYPEIKPGGIFVKLGNPYYQCRILSQNSTHIACLLERIRPPMRGDGVGSPQSLNLLDPQHSNELTDPADVPSKYSVTLSVGFLYGSSISFGQCYAIQGCVLILGRELGPSILGVAPLLVHASDRLLLTANNSGGEDVAFALQPAMTEPLSFEDQAQIDIMDFFSLPGCGNLGLAGDGLFTCQLENGIAAGAYKLIAWWPSFGFAFFQDLIIIQPEVLSISPNSWQADDLVTIAGQGFGGDSSAVVVILGGSECVLVFLSASQIVAKAQSPGTDTAHQVQVIVSGVPASYSVLSPTVSNPFLNMGDMAPAPLPQILSPSAMVSQNIGRRLLQGLIGAEKLQEVMQLIDWQSSGSSLTHPHGGASDLQKSPVQMPSVEKLEASNSLKTCDSSREQLQPQNKPSKPLVSSSKSGSLVTAMAVQSNGCLQLDNPIVAEPPEPAIAVAGEFAAHGAATTVARKIGRNMLSATSVQIEGETRIGSSNAGRISGAVQSQDTEISGMLKDAMTRRRWSDPGQWPSLEVPADGDDVDIPATRHLVLDTNVSVGHLVVHGRLSFQQHGSALVLRAKSIHVTQHGHFQIGSAQRPYSGNALVAITGTPFDKAVNNLSQSIVVEGSMTVFGQRCGSHSLHLAKTAARGDQSLLLNEEAYWEPGLLIYIAASSFNPQQAETAVVRSTEGATVYLTTPLRFVHQGFSQVESIAGKQIETRAKVLLLTRKIQIFAESEYPGHTIQYRPAHSSSRFQISEVETGGFGGLNLPALVIAGRLDLTSERSGIAKEEPLALANGPSRASASEYSEAGLEPVSVLEDPANTSFAGNMSRDEEQGSYVLVENAVLRGLKGPGILVNSSEGSSIATTCIVDAVGPALQISYSSRIRITNNFATSTSYAETMPMQGSYLFAADTSNSSKLASSSELTDHSAASQATYAICTDAEHEKGCPGLVFTDNIAGGSASVGYHLQGESCQTSESNRTAGQEVHGNLAHSSLIGVYMGGRDRLGCQLLSGFSVRHTAEAGILISGAIARAQLQDLVLVDNKAAVVPNGWLMPSRQSVPGRGSSKVSEGNVFRLDTQHVDVSDAVLVGASKADKSICSQLPYSRVLSEVYGAGFCQRSGIDLSSLRSDRDPAYMRGIDQMQNDVLTVSLSNITLEGWIGLAKDSSLIKLRQSGKMTTQVLISSMSVASDQMEFNRSVVLGIAALQQNVALQDHSGPFLSTDLDGSLIGKPSQVFLRNDLALGQLRDKDCTVNPDIGTVQCNGRSLAQLVVILAGAPDSIEAPQLVSTSRRTQIVKAVNLTITHQEAERSIFDGLVDQEDWPALSLQLGPSGRAKVWAFGSSNQDLPLRLFLRQPGAFLLRICGCEDGQSACEASDNCITQTTLGLQNMVVKPTQERPQPLMMQHLTIDIQLIDYIRIDLVLGLSQHRFLALNGRRGLAEALEHRLQFGPEFSVSVVRINQLSSNASSLDRRKMTVLHFSVYIHQSADSDGSRQSAVALNSLAWLLSGLFRYSMDSLLSMEWSLQNATIVPQEQYLSSCYPPCKNYLGRGAQCDSGVCICLSRFEVYTSLGCQFSSEMAMPTSRAFSIDNSSQSDQKIQELQIPMSNLPGFPAPPSARLLGRLVPSMLVQRTDFTSQGLLTEGFTSSPSSSIIAPAPSPATYVNPIQVLLLANNVSSAVLSPVTSFQDEINITAQFSRGGRAINVSGLWESSLTVLSLPNVSIQLMPGDAFNGTCSSWSFELSLLGWNHSQCGRVIRLQLEVASGSVNALDGSTNAVSNTLEIAWWPPGFTVCKANNSLDSPLQIAEPNAVGLSLLVSPASNFYSQEAILKAYRRQLASAAGIPIQDVSIQRPLGALNQYELNFGSTIEGDLRLQAFRSFLTDNSSSLFQQSTITDASEGGQAVVLSDSGTASFASPTVRQRIPQSLVWPPAQPTSGPRAFSQSSLDAAGSRGGFNARATYIAIGGSLGFITLSALLVCIVRYLRYRRQLLMTLEEQTINETASDQGE